jgi:hypothetical protein
MKHILNFFIVTFCITGMFSIVYAYPNGVSGYTLKNGSAGCGCHGSALNNNIQVVIAGPNTLNPGQQGTYTVTMTGGSGTGVGIDIACSNGTLLNSDSNLKLLNSELTQPSKKSYSGGQYIFNFKYTAPTTGGQYILYATGCSKKLEWNHGANFTINVTVPVELVSFTSKIIDRNIELNWTTATETNNKGFELFRNGKLIDFIPGKGTTLELQNYSFIDKNLKNGIYNYRLKQIDFDGSYNFIGNINAAVNSPEDFSLNQNYPNPFNPSTMIEYQIPKSGFVTLKVFNVVGDEVAVLVNEAKDAGTYKINYDASYLKSGIYFYKIQVDGFEATKRMILIK